MELPENFQRASVDAMEDVSHANTSSRTKQAMDFQKLRDESASLVACLPAVGTIDSYRGQESGSLRARRVPATQLGRLRRQASAAHAQREAPK